MFVQSLAAQWRIPRDANGFTLMRHHFLIHCSFGPEQVFRALNSASPEGNNRGVSFDLDWIGRAITFIAPSEGTIRDTTDRFLHAVKREGGDPGWFLPGAITQENDQFRRKVGMLLNGPETYSDLLLRFMAEIGVAGLRHEEHGAGFSLPVNAATKAIQYQKLILEFPLPIYARVVDQGIHD